MDVAVLIPRLVGVSPNDGTVTRRWIHCEAFSATRTQEDYPVAFKRDFHSLPLTKIPSIKESTQSNMTINLTTGSVSAQTLSQNSYLELYLTDSGPKIQAQVFVDENVFDFILSRIDRQRSELFFDFTVNVNSDFSYANGNVWNFPEFPAALNLRVARRSGKFEIERWSVSFPYSALSQD